MILGIDILTALGLGFNFSKHVIIGSDGPHAGCSATMDDVTDYNFKPLMVKIIKTK